MSDDTIDLGAKWLNGDCLELESGEIIACAATDTIATSDQSERWLAPPV